MSAIVQDRVCRETGGRVQVIDSRRDPNFDEDSGGRWITWCVRHEVFVQHDTRALAEWHAPSPSGWCGMCQEGRG